MAPISDAFDQARNAFSQLTSQAGQAAQGVGQAVTQAVNTPRGPNNISLSQAVQQTAPHVAQDFGNMFRQGFGQIPQQSSFSQTPHGQAYNQIIQSVNNTLQPILNNIGNTAQTVGQGVVDTALGGGKLLSDPSLLGKVSGGAQAAYGVGKVLAAQTPLFQGANAVSSLTPQFGQADLPRRLSAGVMQGMSGIDNLAPNVANQNTNLPVFGNVDLAKAAGSAVGFMKNPVNSHIFSATEGINLPIANKMANFVVNTGLKGGLQNVMMNMANMPTNLDTAQKAQYLLKNFGLGAGMSVAGEGLLKGAGAAGEGISTSQIGQMSKEQLGSAYDALQEFMQKHSTPVKTMEMNEQTGQFITRPLWQQHLIENYQQALKNSGSQGGYINFGEIGNALSGKSAEEPMGHAPTPDLADQSLLQKLSPIYHSLDQLPPSLNPVTAQEFEHSLNAPSSSVGNSPQFPQGVRGNTPPPIQDMGTRAQLPGNLSPEQSPLPNTNQISGAFSSPPAASIPTSPVRGGQSPEGFPEQQSHIPQSAGISTANETTGQVTPQKVLDQPSPAEPRLQVSSAGTISSPSNQKIVDDVFSRAKIVSQDPLQNGGAVDAIKNIFDPVANTVQGADITNAFHEHRALFDHAALLAQKESEDLTHQWGKQTPQDHLGFIHSIESGSPQPGQEALFQKYKQRFADDYTIMSGIKSDAAYKENYFTHNGIWADPSQAAEFYSKWQQGSLGGPKGFFEQRTIPTLFDGVKAGLSLKESNPETLYLNNHLNVLKAKMASDFQSEMTQQGLPENAVQAVIDRYMDPGIANNALYKTAQAANGAMNSAQLGLSAFHATTTTVNAITSKMALGMQEILGGKPLSGMKDMGSSVVAPLEYLVKGNKVLSDAFSNNPVLSEDLQNIMKGGGKVGNSPEVAKGLFQNIFSSTPQIDKALENIGQLKNGEGVSGKVFPALKGSMQLPLAVLGKVSAPLMEYAIPRIKLGAFADLASFKLQQLGEDATPEAQRAALSQSWDSIDNRFGQLVQDKMMWNKSFKDVLNLTTRSVGWNVGTLREIGGGMTDLVGTGKGLVQGNGLHVSDRTAYTGALAFTTALMATAYSALHGQSPSSVTDLFYPRTGQVKQPKPNSPDQTPYLERIALPGYLKDVVGFAHNPVQTMINKASPLVGVAQKAVELGTTGGIKDYYGNTVVDPNASPVQKAQQLGSVAAQQVTPFSVSGQNQRVGQDLGTKVESALGFNPAPGYITKGKNADLMNQAFNQKLTVQQTKHLFDLQKQGIDGGNYITSVVNQRATNKAQRAAGTDLTSQKDAAVKAYIQKGDSSKALALGMTGQAMKSYVQGRMITAADALVSGDQKTAQDIITSYQHQIPPKVLMRAAHDHALSLIQTAMSYQQQGNTQDAAKLIDQVYAMKKQYPFQLNQQDKVLLMGNSPTTSGAYATP